MKKAIFRERKKCRHGVHGDWPKLTLPYLRRHDSDRASEASSARLEKPFALGSCGILVRGLGVVW